MGVLLFSYMDLRRHVGLTPSPASMLLLCTHYNSIIESAVILS